MGLPKLKFCEAYTDKLDKNNNHKTCTRVAEYTVILSYPNADKTRVSYRCIDHLNVPTKSSVVVSHKIYTQTEKINKVKESLKSLIGKEVPNKKGIKAKGIAIRDNGILCKDDRDKYVFIFYDWVDMDPV